jgi:excisionase family DNA binding protein
MSTIKTDYTISEAAKILGVSYLGIYKNIKKGKLKAYKKGNVYLLPAEEIDTLLKVKKVGFTVKDLMKIFGVSKQTIFDWIKKKNIKTVRIGKHIYFPPEEITKLKEVVKANR